ncbi:MAG: carboxymuconolactone decarboxylase family protein [Deltaproteobacteria bacterium]|jgi:4-carboxymuconolactone decarboxylase|nr:carboxymuconolactone decarboxylase family protein [Deltaproteobacteria bacterium]MBW2485186.1 carboxymuconolactone decarboxylase family protein [Deltaproteobacteria bacterium]
MIHYTDNYNWLVKTFSKVMNNHQELGKSLRQAGPLDEKNSQLIQLAAAAAIKAEGAVHSHVKRALDAGATPEEVYHTIILLTSTIGFPSTAAALSWAREIIED